MIIAIWIQTYLSFAILNIGMAKLHANIIKHNKKISHGWWALAYAAVCALPAVLFFIHVNLFWLWSWLALVPLHISFFAPALNRYRGLPEFYLSKTSTAITDQTLVRMGFKNMEWPDLIAQFTSTAFFILCIILLANAS